jgi:hypothetical protein
MGEPKQSASAKLYQHSSYGKSLEPSSVVVKNKNKFKKDATKNLESKIKKKAKVENKKAKDDHEKSIRAMEVLARLRAEKALKEEEQAVKATNQLKQELDDEINVNTGLQQKVKLLKERNNAINTDYN